MVARNIDDEIVALPALGEVLLGVINNLVCAERSDHIQFPRAVHAGHVRSVRLGKLHGEGSHTTARTVDQNLLSWLYLRSEEYTSELQSRQYLVCRLLLEKKK